MTQPRHDDPARDLMTANQHIVKLERVNDRMHTRLAELEHERDHWRQVANAVDTTWRAKLEGVLRVMTREGWPSD